MSSNTQQMRQDHPRLPHLHFPLHFFCKIKHWWCHKGQWYLTIVVLQTIHSFKLRKSREPSCIFWQEASNSEQNILADLLVALFPIRWIKAIFLQFWQSNCNFQGFLLIDVKTINCNQQKVSSGKSYDNNPCTVYRKYIVKSHPARLCKNYICFLFLYFCFPSRRVQVLFFFINHKTYSIFFIKK